MKPSEFLFEAEQNIKKAKADQYLDQLSDADLVAVASLLKGSLEESAQDLSAQKKAGKRIDGRPSDFIAYNDTNQTAKRYQETPQGLRVLDVNYSPPPRGYVSPGQSAPVITPQPEVKQYVASLDNKEKEALLNVVKKEAKKRKSEPKKSEPKKSSSGKIVAGVLAGLLTLGIFNIDSPDSAMDSSSSSSTSQSTGVVKPFTHGDGSTYYTMNVKSDPSDPNVKIYLGKRVSGKSEKELTAMGLPKTSYSIYAVDLKRGKGVNIDISRFRSDFDDETSAVAQFNNEVPLTNTYALTPGSSQYIRYQLLKDKF